MLRVESHIVFHAMQSLYGNAWAALALRKGRELLSKNRYDVIMSRALPEYAHLPALILARESGIPWIANWNDPASLRLLPPPYGNGPDSRPEGGLILGDSISDSSHIGFGLGLLRCACRGVLQKYIRIKITQLIVIINPVFIAIGVV